MIEPPYPADTRAKGWRFELDLERIRQSDTWALAPADVRPWLLMLWAVAWEQTPCGSMPADDALVAARIGMQPKSFSKARAVLMRGWVEHADGRLYHATMTERVQEMLDYRAKNAKRVAGFKERMREQRAANALLASESPAKNDTGTGTGTTTEAKASVSGPAQAPKPPPPAFDGKNAETLNGKSVVALAPDWELPEQWGMDAEALGFKPAEVLLEAEKLRQWATVGKGAGTRRSVKGWRQTWSNWLGKTAEHKR